MKNTASITQGFETQEGREGRWKKNWQMSRGIQE